MTFKSVTAALAFWRKWQEAIRSGMAVPMEPREFDGGVGGREDILAVYLSVDVVVMGALNPAERQAIDQVFNAPNRRVVGAEYELYHRAMTKLGIEMRQRGLVG